ncbi:HTH-type transcriptional regulator HdfR [Cupriavidus yeoncheonensis]|uniref:HTH-type transcriptional regulator HdfR n=1 Tax=Cupriavidus yeoncheonensis TaxID=1462994 RepID=A0A916ITK5_9BURK|nr:LysR family transcriptional regulator [Cupriavidus yeoncheonensis]CAG2137526.1 HTH-type transcriptional regulator HdfR [Cupriavidus yeoncheonensis]
MITKIDTKDHLPDGLIERDLRGLRIFRVAAEARGFGAAESRLGMSRATISRRIKEVESKLGTPLCTRGPQGFELTEAGRAVLGLTAEALDALDRIKPHVDALRGLVSGDLAVGITDHAFSNPACRVSDALQQLNEAAPGVRLEAHTLTINELTRALLERRIHVAIQGVHVRTASLQYVELFQETHCIYTLNASAIGRSRPPLVNRIGQPFVQNALSELGFERGPDAVGLDSVALFVCSGRFSGILPRHYVDQLAARVKLEIVPGTPQYTVTFCAVTDRTRPLPPSGARFIELLRALHPKLS